MQQCVFKKLFSSGERHQCSPAHHAIFAGFEALLLVCFQPGIFGIKPVFGLRKPNKLTRSECLGWLHSKAVS